jgi:hypothetical protein
MTTINKNNYHLLEKPEKHITAPFSTRGTMVIKEQVQKSTTNW